MAQYGRYQPVSASEETHVTDQPATSDIPASPARTQDDKPNVPPPPYSAVYVSLPVNQVGSSELPPAYNEATIKLPTYEEASEGRQDISNARLTLESGKELELGSDCTFAACFFFAFAFNWVGFLAGYCMTKTIAGHYGAIAGFGLSVVKWTWVMKNTSHKDLFGAPWVWWLFVATGWLVFMRGFLVYLHFRFLVKRNRILTSQPLGVTELDTQPN